PREDEFVVASHNEFRYVLWKKQVKLLLYAGGATNECLLARPTGVFSVTIRHDEPTGFTVAVVEDCTIPSPGVNADGATVKKTMMDFFERLAFVTRLQKLKDANAIK
ncbi:MAG TPA: hypothetical protein VJ521_09850, partial [Acidobacteriota bacterium]|nr:hypothetical protein [Acidobacteriota bacterium]